MPINPAAAGARIRNLGSYLDHYEQRERLLRAGLEARVDAPAEYVVMTGCNPLFALTPVRSFLDLLNYYEVSYTCLAREACCGRPLVEGMFYQPPEDAARVEHGGLIREMLGRNVARARELGARTIINLCAGCDMTWHLYGEDLGIELLYYTEFLLRFYRAGRLNRAIDYYEGCHRVHKLASNSLARGVAATRELFARTEGLKVNELNPELCCREMPAEIFAAGRTDTLVTPTQCCFGLLKAARPPDGPAIKFLPEILDAALKENK